MDSNKKLIRLVTSNSILPGKKKGKGKAIGGGASFAIAPVPPVYSGMTFSLQEALVEIERVFKWQQKNIIAITYKDFRVNRYEFRVVVLDAGAFVVDLDNKTKIVID